MRLVGFATLVTDELERNLSGFVYQTQNEIHLHAILNSLHFLGIFELFLYDELNLSYEFLDNFFSVTLARLVGFAIVTDDLERILNLSGFIYYSGAELQTPHQLKCSLRLVVNYITVVY